MTTTLRDQLAKTLHEAEDGPDCPYAAKHRETYEPLADAVLALFDVEEQWRTVIDMPQRLDGLWIPIGPLTTEGLPPNTTGHVERRFVLAAKPEVVEPHDLDAGELTTP